MNSLSPIPSRRPSVFFLLASLLVTSFFFASKCDAQLTIVARKSLPGKILRIDKNSVQVKTDAGDQTISFTIPGETSVPLAKAGVNLRHTTTIEVKGKVSLNALNVGQVVKFKALLNKSGKCKSPIAEFEIIDEKAAEKIKPARKPENTRDYVECEVYAQIASIRRQAIGLVLAKQDFAPTGKLRIRAEETAIVRVNESSLDRCQEGDLVKVLAAFELDSGDIVAERMLIELDRTDSTKDKKAIVKSTDLFDPKNYLKFSDKPSVPRWERSSHFALHTDISERSARMLLDKLEYMIALISKYYGRLPNGIIKCYVVRDLRQWKDIPLEADGIAKIRQRAGVTISRGIGKQKTAVVYSCDDHGVVQHEAVHAYCFQTFGDPGPTWYAEGMAEMGQYWKKGNLAVDIPAPVIRYLVNAPPKKLKAIVAAGQITGDSWQAYAWRWALCHLLANNTNYSGRFKGLGLNMMSKGGATFESVYGDVAREISFEYDEFVKNFGNGYRVDLCQWDWGSKPNAISGQRRIKCKVDSIRGWQASKLKLNKGKKYEYVCVGEWKTAKDSKSTDGSGDNEGKGKLLGVIFADYKLGEVMELGQKGVFVAPADGHLFLRCKDEFTELSDNRGAITVHFRRAME